jgi:phage-related minor tail protein
MPDPTFGGDDDALAAFAAADDRLAQSDIRLRDLERTARAFSRTMSQAFALSATGARGFDDVLKGLYLRLSGLALQLAFKPVEHGLTSVLSGLFGGLNGGGAPAMQAAAGAVKPFAAGGIIGTPTYFSLSAGGLGLAGEAGPEAIMPLSRTADGRLGVAAAARGAQQNIVVNITTPDADSFRRSEVYLTGQIARAVARGQRGL